MEMETEISKKDERTKIAGEESNETNDKIDKSCDDTCGKGKNVTQCVLQTEDDLIAESRLNIFILYFFILFIVIDI